MVLSSWVKGVQLKSIQGLAQKSVVIINEHLVKIALYDTNNPPPFGHPLLTKKDLRRAKLDQNALEVLASPK